MITRKREETPHPAQFWKKERNGVRCGLCPLKCFIAKEKLGFCKVRKNINNRLFTLNYGRTIGIVVDTVEKTPLFQFHPNARTLFLGIPGCNIFSDFCSSYELGHGLHEKTIEEIKTKFYTPDKLVSLAERKNCSIITFTYTEPFLGIEFALKVCKLAHRVNIKTVFVTNGYVEEEAVKKLAKYLDAAVVNVRASADPEFYKKFMNIRRIKQIFNVLKQMKKYRIFMEITNQIIPQLGDNLEQCEKFAQWISNELSSEVPFHILPFYPEYKMMELPATPNTTLKNCASAAIKAGLRYVYIDNSPIVTGENTYCYNCRELLIERIAGRVKKVNLVDDRCPVCGMRINIIR